MPRNERQRNSIKGAFRKSNWNATNYVRQTYESGQFTESHLQCIITSLLAVAVVTVPLVVNNTCAKELDHIDCCQCQKNGCGLR
mmetsp:Transcript_26348/g.26741  ORF Transcript_26348/g.26741 Transcript_26348/m.26741 type:complete len:84 (-) Transcript_26348:156-407(-)